MIPRTLEPELMDEREQARAYADADFDDVNQGFVVRFRTRFPDFRSGRVVDLGCGPADIPIRMCREFPDLEVVGIDGAEAMIAIGREEVARAALASQITLRTECLPLVRPEDVLFDAGISNSLLHHLHDPMVLWKSLRGMLKPGAPILVVDLRRPSSRDEARTLVEDHASGAPAVLERDFFNSLLAAFTPDEVRAQLELCGISGLDVEEISDRHLAIAGRLG